MSAETANPGSGQRLSQPEFVALMAMLYATVAFSIDAMLPALPEIAAEISPDAPNRAQLIITSFVLGMGIGTMFTGPLSDAFGRKPVIIGGAMLYVVGATLAWQAQSIEAIFAARLIQGLGAAGPRVVALAIIRDLYSGRNMAQLMSFIMLVFTMVPALAPSMGAVIIWAAGWRAIFPAFIVFSMMAVAWLMLRQPETLPVRNRRPFNPATLLSGAREVITHRVVSLSLATQALCLGMLFATLSSTQQVFDETYGYGASFHLWFGGIAIVAGSSGLINAFLVQRLGMRFMITTVLAAQVMVSALVIAVYWSGVLSGPAEFVLYVAWTTGVFFQVGLTLGNLNALAMEPMGHLAGLTASVVGSVATIMAVIIAIPIGLAFDGTPLPLMIGSFLLASGALILMLVLRWSDRSVISSG